MPSLGRIDGRVFTTEPNLNVNKSNVVSLELLTLIVVLLRSTNQRIQPGLTPGRAGHLHAYTTLTYKWLFRLFLTHFTIKHYYYVQDGLVDIIRAVPQGTLLGSLTLMEKGNMGL